MLRSNPRLAREFHYEKFFVLAKKRFWSSIGVGKHGFGPTDIEKNQKRGSDDGKYLFL